MKAGDGAGGTTEACPVPVKALVADSSPAETLSVADSPAVVEGVKITRTVQEPEAATVAPLTQLPPAFEKSTAFAPVNTK